MKRATRLSIIFLALVGCREAPRPGTYDQVLTEGSPAARSGYKSTLVIEPDNRFRYQMPVMSISGEYRRSGDSLYFETGSADVRMVALRGRMVRDTLVLEQPQMGMLRGMIGPDLAVQRFVRRR
ncbi:MAG: hypothetical protein ABR499_08860 [Gemmatimonadaceae bacterium]